MLTGKAEYNALYLLFGLVKTKLEMEHNHRMFIINLDVLITSFNNNNEMTFVSKLTTFHVAFIPLSKSRHFSVMISVFIEVNILSCIVRLPIGRYIQSPKEAMICFFVEFLYLNQYALVIH